MIPLLRLKYQLGSKATFAYYPFLGQFVFWAKMYVKRGDAFYFERNVTKANPNPDAVCHLTNILVWPAINLADPNYVKEIFINHENYEKWDIVPDDYIGFKLSDV
jgi:hypothetical protein